MDWKIMEMTMYMCGFCHMTSHWDKTDIVLGLLVYSMWQRGTLKKKKKINKVEFTVTAVINLYAQTFQKERDLRVEFDR